MIATLRHGLLVVALLLPAARAVAAQPFVPGVDIGLAGGLAPNGKAASLAKQIWADEKNAEAWSAPARSQAKILRRRIPMEAQIQGVTGQDVDQFRQSKTGIVLWPPRLKTGDLSYPYTDARQ